jgi:LPS-assembly protein
MNSTKQPGPTGVFGGVENRMRTATLALAAAWCLTGEPVQAQAVGPTAPMPLQPSRKLKPLPAADAAKGLPAIVRAREMRARPDLDAEAEGDVEFIRGDVLIRSDSIRYEVAEDLALARGQISLRRDGLVVSGDELQLKVQRFEGFVLRPEFDFAQIGAGGSASRIDFIDSARAVAHDARYTSCPRDGSGDPDWVLKAKRVTIDLDNNEGLAEGAELRFLGVTLLALPTISFPLSDARKSGWLPPSLNIDSRSGVELAVPYYWNIAPNRDATLVPRVLTRRGFGLDAEFRYLEPGDDGLLAAELLPFDRAADRSRHALRWRHEGAWPRDSRNARGTRYWADVVRVSDDEWWKDFPDAGRSLAPRLLAQAGGVETPFKLPGGSGLAYARVQQWQVLQGSEQRVTSPYQRSPQVGLQLASRPYGLEAALTSEFNRFTLPAGEADPARPLGERWHAEAALSLPWRPPGGWVVPRVALQTTQYRLDEPMADGRRHPSRTVPTFSVDSGLTFERETEGFGRALRQTLEPRLMYVNTPFRDQTGLPNFDSAGKDFNFSSIFSENAFSGVDRISDAHQVTAGATTRLFDTGTGAEVLRLGAVQRYLLRDQRVAPQPDGSVDGAPLEQRFSDVLLLGSTSVLPGWTLDGSTQYSADSSRPVRSVLAARYSPGPFRTVGVTYRYARQLSEQVEIGWQWPLRLSSEPTPASWAAASPVGAATAARGSACGGNWYTVGRVNYSQKDSRLTDALLGFEYDAGCWIMRVVGEQLSIGRSEATKRLLVQLELIGLSRLGSNPLRVLKDNIPGYRLLRDDPRRPSEPPPYE